MPAYGSGCERTRLQHIVILLEEWATHRHKGFPLGLRPTGRTMDVRNAWGNGGSYGIRLVSMILMNIKVVWAKLKGNMVVLLVEVAVLLSLPHAEQLADSLHTFVLGSGTDVVETFPSEQQGLGMPRLV